MSAYPFIGRENYLEILEDELGIVRADRVGRFVSMRGRRRVGKSRLVEEFVHGTGLPYVYYTATHDPLETELENFTADVAASSLPGASDVAGGLSFRNWSAALSWVATQATPEALSILVIDELPYLVETDPGFEATLQRVWDRELSKRPVLVVIVGSDVSMMEALNQYGRPLYQRPTKEVVVEPFTPWELASMLGLSPTDAFDAYLVIGGFPLIAQAWRSSSSLWKFLERQLSDPTSPLIVTGERIMRAEFPTETQAADVLRAIRGGGRTFPNIQRDARNIAATSLNRSLTTLVETKGVVDALLPHVPGKSKETRYIVKDAYLRFWLRYIRPNLDAIERGRSDLVVERIRNDWSTYRGKAIEPVVQRSIERMLPDDRFDGARSVGGYWTRTNDPEVDLTGLAYDQHHRPTRTAFVGSIKWRGRSPFGRSDTNALDEVLPLVPSTDEETLRVGVSTTGFRNSGLDVELEPAELLGAWKPRRT